MPQSKRVRESLTKRVFACQVLLEKQKCFPQFVFSSSIKEFDSSKIFLFKKQNFQIPFCFCSILHRIMEKLLRPLPSLSEYSRNKKVEFIKKILEKATVPLLTSSLDQLLELATEWLLVRRIFFLFHSFLKFLRNCPFCYMYV